MPAPFRARSAGGLLAAAALGLSTAVLAAPGVAQATPSELDVTSATGQLTTVEVPTGTCAIDWTIYGGRGGGNDTPPYPVPGGSPIGEQIRTLVAAGDAFVLAPGSRGQNAGSDPAGGTNPAGDGAWDGAAGTVTAGGGGAASVVLKAGTVYLSGSGGYGYGPGEGDRTPPGLVDDPWTAQRLVGPDTSSMAPSMPADESDGYIRAVGVACGTEAVRPPQYPYITSGFGGPGQIRLTVGLITPPGPVDPSVAKPSGWEYSLNGGTWTAATAGGAPIPGTTTSFVVGGLTDGTPYTVRVRATSFLGPSEASQPLTFMPYSTPGAPTGVHVVAGPSRLEISWAPGTPGTFPLAGYTVLKKSEEAGERGEDVICSTEPDVHSCVAPVPAGQAYSVAVVATDEHYFPSPAVFVDSPVVPSPEAPQTVPDADDVLSTDKGAISAVTGGQQVTLTGDGYAPGSTVELFIYSTPQSLGSVTTDENGAFSTTVRIPSGLESGTHHLVAAGVDESGEARYLRMDVTLAAGTPGAEVSTVASPSASTSASGGGAEELAWTGFEALPFAVGGGLALAAGAALLVAGRRRRAS